MTHAVMSRVFVLSLCALPHALPSTTSLVYKCRNGPKVVTGTDFMFDAQRLCRMGVVTYEVHILSLNTERTVTCGFLLVLKGLSTSVDLSGLGTH